jgi:hypothetical protein
MKRCLQGLGVMMALPAMESLIGPAFGPRRALADATDPRRLLFMYVPNGIHMQSWTPAEVGAGFTLPPTLAPLSALRAHVNVLSGLDNRSGEANVAGDHARGTGSFLTCTQVHKTNGEDIMNGVSADQVAAQALAGVTALPSLQLGVEGGTSTGDCDSGYSCAYARNISWSGPSTPLPKMTNPRLVFNRMFSGLDPLASAEEQARRLTNRRSILDAVREDATRLQTQLAATDRAKLDEYLTGVRALEVRLDGTSTSAPACTLPTTPPSDEGAYADYVRAMVDLSVLSFQCDQTRIITLMVGNAGSNRSYDFLGISGAHHELSHHQNDPANFAKLEVINRWEVEQFAYLVAQLADKRDHLDRPLLDTTLAFFSSEIADGNSHAHRGLPVLLAGKGGGASLPGRHLQFDGEPIANLFISMIQSVDPTASAFGADGVRPLPGLAG